MSIRIHRRGAKAQRPKLIKIKVCRADNIPAFGAWMACKIPSENRRTLLLNLEAIFGPQVYSNGRPSPLLSRKECIDLLIETLMHEFGHALQEYFGRRFSERQVEKIIASFRNKSSPRLGVSAVKGVPA